MRMEEVTALLKTISVYQRDTQPDEEQARTAWYMALDVNITLVEAQRIAVAAASEGRWITPGFINDVYLTANRPPHQQGRPRPKLPIGDPYRRTATAAAPLQIGAEQPVKPQDVPAYVAARNGKVYGSVPAWRVPCPHCGARIGKPCTVTWGGRDHALTDRTAHPAREAAAGIPDQFSRTRKGTPPTTP